MVIQVNDPSEKEWIARTVLADLPEWFGIPEATEQYVSDSKNQLFFAEVSGETPIGFLCLKETGKDTVELAVMGVLKEMHHHGIGRKLFAAAKAYAAESGYLFMQVKTVQMGCYESYDDTNKFYLSLGFREFEVFPTLWDEWNPCQIYVMTIK